MKQAEVAQKVQIVLFGFTKADTRIDNDQIAAQTQSFQPRDLPVRRKS